MPKNKYLFILFLCTISGVFGDIQISHRNLDEFGTYPHNVSRSGCESGSECVLIRNCRLKFDPRANSRNKCSEYEICCALEHQIGNSNKLKCGKRNINGLINMEVDSKHSKFGEFPWVVAVIKELYLSDVTQHVYLCGGSIIHPRLVLTTANCVFKGDLQDLIVRAGEWNHNYQLKSHPYQERRLKDIYVHKLYNNNSAQNDIALLYLEEEFHLTDHINTICLPPFGINLDNVDCFATGWGKDKFGPDGKYASIMKKVELNIITRVECEEKLRKTRLGRRFNLHESFICAGGEPGVDTCSGDGGSPLFCKIPEYENRYYQAGIVLWGIGCHDSVPAVYADISYFREWIDNVYKSKINIE